VIATGASENISGTLAMTYGLYCRRSGYDGGILQPRTVRGRTHQAGPGSPGTWIASAHLRRAERSRDCVDGD